MPRLAEEREIGRKLIMAAVLYDNNNKEKTLLEHLTASVWSEDGMRWRKPGYRVDRGCWCEVGNVEKLDA